jgi:hypothetical protein
MYSAGAGTDIQRRLIVAELTETDLVHVRFDVESVTFQSLSAGKTIARMSRAGTFEIGSLNVSNFSLYRIDKSTQPSITGASPNSRSPFVSAIIEAF